MEELEFLESLREKKQADKHTLYLLGKLYKEKNLFKEALTVFSEALLGKNEQLNAMVLKEITEISSMEVIDDEEFEELDETSEDEIDECYNTDNIKIVENIIQLPTSIKDDTITFKDVGGLENLKKAIDMKIIKPFQSPEIFAKFKKKIRWWTAFVWSPGLW